MKTTGGTDAQKRRAAAAAVGAVEDGAVVGLGTGSTTAFAIRVIGDRIVGGLDVRGVSTSFAARELARECGIPVVDLGEVGAVDLAINGVDQAALADSVLAKGGDAAHVREKVVDAFVDRFLVVADPSEIAETLSHAVPVEVLSSAWATVAAGVSDLGGKATLRCAERKDGPVVTDNGNLVLDCELGTIPNPESSVTDLASLPGTAEHGLFVGPADAVYVGTDDGVEVTELWLDRSGARTESGRPSGPTLGRPTSTAPVHGAGRFLWETQPALSGRR